MISFPPRLELLASWVLVLSGGCGHMGAGPAFRERLVATCYLVAEDGSLSPRYGAEEPEAVSCWERLQDFRALYGEE